MTDYMQLLVQAGGLWHLVAVFQSMNDCEAIAALVRQAWAVNASCLPIVQG